MKKTRLGLLLSGLVFALTGCGAQQCIKVYVDDGWIYVDFDTCISLKTNKIKQQSYETAHKVKRPNVVITDENPENLQLYGWYKDKEYTQPWDFKTDVATESMTLYAKFVSKYTVNYYQGFDENSFAYIGAESVFKGDAVPNREDLPDCYENPGQYYLTNLNNTENKEKATRGEIVKDTSGSPKSVDYSTDCVNQDLDILLTRSSNIYFSPGAIKRRFTPVAATLGGNGSTVGKITLEKDKNDEEYAKVDFGTISEKETVVDPYILMDNPQIDVTNSEYLEITMKNVGIGESIGFYWVGKWEVDGKWINGKEYHSFDEDRTFKFKKGESKNDYENGIARTDLNGRTYLNKQDPDGDWVTYKLPLAAKLNRGVSTWGCAGKITALRIQSTFDKNKVDKSQYNNNIIYIKSIRGVKDTEHTYDFVDTNSINSLKTNASDSSLNEASNNQTAVKGWVFPKNNNQIVTTETSAIPTYTTTDVYKHVDGTFFSSSYIAGPQKIVLKPNENISLDEYTTLILSYRNFSYVDKFTVSFVAEHEHLGDMIESEAIYTLNSPTQMSAVADTKINMFGAAGYQGKLKYVVISFTPIGVDNMLEICKLQFNPYEAKQINGYNFNDFNFAKFEGEAGVSMRYDNSYNATAVSTTATDKSISLDNQVFDTTLIDSFTLNYSKEDSNGISKVVVKLSDGNQSEELSIDVEKGRSLSKTVKLTKKFVIKSTEIKFVGVGQIYLHSIDWNFIEESLDLSTGEFYNANIKQKSNAYPLFNYSDDELAIYTTDTNSQIWARLGAWKYKVNNKQVQNISLANKTKVAILYQNRTDNTMPFYLSFGACSKVAYLADNKYLTADSIPNYNVVLGGESKKPDVTEDRNRVLTVNNMKSSEWRVATIDIDPFFTRTGDLEAYLTSFYLNVVKPGGVYIRALGVI